MILVALEGRKKGTHRNSVDFQSYSTDKGFRGKNRWLLKIFYFNLKHTHARTHAQSSFRHCSSRGYSSSLKTKLLLFYLWGKCLIPPSFRNSHLPHLKDHTNVIVKVYTRNGAALGLSAKSSAKISFARNLQTAWLRGAAGLKCKFHINTLNHQLRIAFTFIHYPFPHPSSVFFPSF